jgi:hypothetical protein
MYCFRSSFYFSSHKKIIFLIEKQFSFIFSKIIKHKILFFVSETAKTASDVKFVQSNFTKIFSETVFYLSVFKIKKVK